MANIYVSSLEIGGGSGTLIVGITVQGGLNLEISADPLNIFLEVD